MMKNPNAALLSLFRFIAAIIVIFTHHSDNSEILNNLPSVFTSGPQMVTFFFVMSGFGLVFAYYGKADFSLTEYLAKRLSRILPLYFIALFLCLIIIYFKSAIDTVAVILNILFLQSWFPPYTLSINYPGWFVSVLIFFYLLFPFFVFFLKKYAPKPKNIFMNAIFLWLCTQIILFFLINNSYYRGFPSKSHDLIFFFPIVHLCSFTLGAAGAYWIKSSQNINLSRFTSVVLIALQLIVISVLIGKEESIETFFTVKFPFMASFYAPIFLLFIITIHLSDFEMVSNLSVKPFIALGEISFAVYILQDPVWDIVYLSLKNYNVSYDIILLLFMCLLFLVGIFSMKYVDVPIRRYIYKKLFSY